MVSPATQQRYRRSRRSAMHRLRTRGRSGDMEGATIRVPPAPPRSTRRGVDGESAAPRPAATSPTTRRRHCSSRTRQLPTPSPDGRSQGNRRLRAGARPGRQNRKPAIMRSSSRRRGLAGTRMAKLIGDKKKLTVFSILFAPAVCVLYKVFVVGQTSVCTDSVY